MGRKQKALFTPEEKQWEYIIFHENAKIKEKFKLYKDPVSAVSCIYSFNKTLWNIMFQVLLSITDRAGKKKTPCPHRNYILERKGRK